MYLATATATFVGTPTWNADLYGALSVSSRLSALIASRSAQFKISMYFWSTNRKLEGFLDSVDRDIAKAEKGELKSQNKATREDVEKAIGRLIDLHCTLDNIHKECLRYRLNNSSRIAPAISRFHRNAERIEELAHWLNDMINPDYQDAFATAQAEFEKGETVPASEVCR